MDRECTGARWETFAAETVEYEAKVAEAKETGSWKVRAENTSKWHTLIKSMPGPRGVDPPEVLVPPVERVVCYPNGRPNRFRGTPVAAPLPSILEVLRLRHALRWARGLSKLNSSGARQGLLDNLWGDAKPAPPKRPKPPEELNEGGGDAGGLPGAPHGRHRCAAATLPHCGCLALLPRCHTVTLRARHEYQRELESIYSSSSIL
jgi:hypothetical protein